MAAQPARHKGLGLRRVDDFAGLASFVGAVELAPRRLIDWRAEDGSQHAGLYPLLEPLLGAGSQDYGYEDRRFE